MGQVLFVTWSGGGNLTPVFGIGERLLARGHAVRVLGDVNMAERVSASGMTHRANPSGAWSSTADDVLAEVRREPPDAIVVDFMMPEAMCGAERSEVPTAALVHTLYQPLADGDMDLMSAFTLVSTVNDLREGLGLAPIKRMPDLLDHVERVIAAMPDELDAPVHTPGRNVRYTGAVLELAGPDAGWTPPGRPLVVVSLGTTPMGEEPLLQRVLDALDGQPVHVLGTAGDHIDTSALRVPANTRISRYVRHAAVMPHADLLVTHAGLGSVVAAAAFGVPMVCIPLGREQPNNAARVATLRMGRVLDVDASVDELRAAITDVLSNAEIREAARQIGARIGGDAGGDRGAAEVEALLRVV